MSYQTKISWPDQFQTVAAILASDWAEKHKNWSGKTLYQGLFSPFFTFLRALFFRPFRLSLAPTICPWVSEDANCPARTKYKNPDLFFMEFLENCRLFRRR